MRKRTACISISNQNYNIIKGSANIEGKNFSEQIVSLAIKSLGDVIVERNDEKKEMSITND